MKAPAGHKADRGVATILVVGVLVVFLIFFIVIGIDFAYVFVARGEAQNAADAASLAGVTKLGSAVDTSTAAFSQIDARREAWKFACKNRVAGKRMFLEVPGPETCDPSGLSVSDLNGTTNAADGDIIVGHWRQGGLPSDSCATGWQAAGGGYFCRANGSTGHSINAVKVVARRTGDSPGGRVGLIFGRLVGWDAMAVSQVAIASFSPPFIAPLPICLPSCNLRTPLKVEWNYEKTHNDANATPPNNPIYCTDSNLPPGNGGSNSDAGITASSTPGQLMQLGPSTQAANVKMPGLAWTNFNINICNVNPACNTPNPGEIRPYVVGERSAPDICGKNICTTNGTMQTVLGQQNDDPGDETLRGQFLQNRKVWDVGGQSINGWLVFVPVVSDLSCGNPDQPCPGAQAGAANPYEVLSFAKVLVTDVVTTGDAKGIRIVGMNNPRNETFTFTCKQGNANLTKTITRRVASINCIECGEPLITEDSDKARLVR